MSYPRAAAHGIVAVLAAATLTLGFTQAAVASHRVDLRADLVGESIDGEKPRGEAQFKDRSDRDDDRDRDDRDDDRDRDDRDDDRDRDDREFRVEIENVNLADGTELTVTAAGEPVGAIVLKREDGELSLRSDEGDDVPALVEGDEVTVDDADGNTILSGTLESGR